MKTKMITSLFTFFIALSLSAQINGTIDSAFGTNGIQAIVHASDDIEASIVQFGTDNKYYVACNIGSGNGRDILLTRYLSNGNPDPSFGNNGKVLFDPFIGGSDYVNDMKLGANNTIIIVGNSNVGNSQYYIARFLANGTQDTTFNHTGLSTGGSTFYDTWKGCTLNPNGDITVVGALSNADGSNKVIARYKSNGSLDSAFGYNGMNILDEVQFESFSMIFRKNNNQYYLIGESNGVDNLYAYDGSGDLINSFGSSGKFSFNQLTGYRVYVLDMAIEGNDIFVAGYARNMQTNKVDVLVGKMNSNGVLKSNFGFGGYYRADLASGENDLASEIKILSDGSVFLAGETENTNGLHTNATYLLASDGSLYSSYGNNGVMHYPIVGSEHAFTMYMTEDNLGRLTLLVWNHTLGGKIEAALLRLKTTVSGIGLVEATATTLGLSAYPNPTEGQLFVTLNTATTGTLTFALLDITGRQMGSKTLKVATGENTLDLSELMQNTQNGMYLLQVAIGGNTIATLKVTRR